MDEHVYIFSGRVIPERALIDVAEVGFRTIENPDIPQGELHVQILRSQISVRYVGSGEVKNIFTLRNLVEDAVRTILDVAGYHVGYGYDAEIIQVVMPHSSFIHVFGIDVPALAGLVAKSGLSIQDIFGALAKSDGNYLREALADAREAIKSPRDTGFFCYRAIESLRNCCAVRNGVPPEDRDEAWTLFRDTYSIARNEIMQIKNFSDAPRHGNWQGAISMSDKDRADILTKTWEMVLKFILREKVSPG
jgi:hypothetical protein